MQESRTQVRKILIICNTVSELVSMSTVCYWLQTNRQFTVSHLCVCQDLIHNKLHSQCPGRALAIDDIPMALAKD